MAKCIFKRISFILVVSMLACSLHPLIVLADENEKGGEIIVTDLDGSEAYEDTEDSTVSEDGILQGGESMVYVPTTLKPAVKDDMIVHFLNVGKADSILIQKGDYVVLIDSGYARSGNDVVTYMRNLGIDHLDKVVFTHYHSDHVGGLPAVVKVYKPAEIYVPLDPYRYGLSKKSRKIAEACGSSFIIPEPGDIIADVDGMTLKVLSDSSKHKRKTTKEVNNSSIVVRAVYGSKSFLFTGDILANVDRELIDMWGNELKSDVLKVAHHGTASATSEEFVEIVQPKKAVMMTDKEITYTKRGYNNIAIRRRIVNHGATLYTTPEDGTIIMDNNGSDIRVFTNVTRGGNNFLGAKKWDFNSIELPSTLYEQGTRVVCVSTLNRALKIPLGQTFRLELVGLEPRCTVAGKSAERVEIDGCMIKAVKKGSVPVVISTGSKAERNLVSKKVKLSITN